MISIAYLIYSKSENLLVGVMLLLLLSWPIGGQAQKAVGKVAAARVTRTPERVMRQFDRQQPISRPNVILIMTDDQGYGDMSCHGNPVIQTPNLDRLHGQSLRLTDYHVAPMCTPTRGQLMTGVDAARNGAINVSSGRTLLRTQYPTMGEVFAQNGYQTALFGKWHLGDNFPYRPEDRGFGETLWFPSSHIGSVPDYWGNDYFDDMYIHNGQRAAQQGYCTDVLFSKAIDWMSTQAKQNKPFFTYLPLNAPHSPLQAPKEDLEAMEKVFATNAIVAGLDPQLRADLMKFLAMIRNVDTNVGRLMAFLDKAGLRDNTILIFTTDNGSTFGNRYYNAGMRGKKTELWEGGHRVPFFISWPRGLGNQPADIGGLSQAQDVLPTLMALCGLQSPKASTRFDGMSLAANLQKKATLPAERMLFINYSRMPFTDYPTPASLSIMHKAGAGVLWKRWRLLEDNQLYDLKTDPMQEKNVIAQHPDVAARMRQGLNQWWNGVKATANEAQTIPIGNAKANPLLLTACEWMDVFVDQQSQVVSGVHKNSYWKLSVAEAGEYEFELRRWPLELDRPLTAGGEPGRALPIAKARIFVSNVEQKIDLPSGSKSAQFTVSLPAGPTYLHTWFYDERDDPIAGAYYVYVTKK